MDQPAELYQFSTAHFLAPIAEYMSDDSVSEVMINGPDEVYIERGGRLIQTEAAFEDADALYAAVRNIAQYVGKRLTPENVSVEARLPDGSRVHIVQSPAARKGICVAIRKFSKNKLDVNGLIKSGSLTDESAEFLDIAVSSARNIIVSGGTGSGKTTLLNCLSAMIPDGERIIVLEDSSELQLQKEHVVPFEVTPPDRYGRGGIDMRGLFRASLRMRPDRIIVGECRGGEALDMIQAMNSGHGGSMSTAHANSPVDALARLEVMSLMGDIEMPLSALRTQIASAVDLVVQITRFHSGERRITHISEVCPLDGQGNYTVKDIFRLTGQSDHPDAPRQLAWTGEVPGFVEELRAEGHLSSVTHTEAMWASA